MKKALSDYAAVEAAAAKLGKANVECDFNLCRDIFLEDAAIVGCLDEKASVGSVADLDAAISSQGPLPAFRNRADILAFDGDMAIVRVAEEEVVGNNYVNYLILAKVGDEWKCVSMTYTKN